MTNTSPPWFLDRVGPLSGPTYVGRGFPSPPSPPLLLPQLPHILQEPLTGSVQQAWEPPPGPAPRPGPGQWPLSLDSKFILDILEGRGGDSPPYVCWPTQWANSVQEPRRARVGGGNWGGDHWGGKVGPTRSVSTVRINPSTGVLAVQEHQERSWDDQDQEEAEGRGIPSLRMLAHSGGQLCPGTREGIWGLGAGGGLPGLL